MVNFGSWIRESRNLRRFLLAVAVLLGGNSLGEQNPAPAVEPGIQDNSFLVEEAYNQNFGVVQHISSFTRFWSSKDWNYSFTQEWPVPGDERHQLSYTLVAFTLILPAGDPMQGRGAGSFGVQTGLPMSVVLNKKLVSHWNVGATYFPHAQDELGDRASSAGYNLGQSFIWLVHARFNVILETVFVQSQTVVASNRTEWTNSLFLSPGIRWSHLQKWFADRSRNGCAARSRAQRW
jgi:hypothetical protein